MIIHQLFFDELFFRKQYINQTFDKYKNTSCVNRYLGNSYLNKPEDTNDQKIKNSKQFYYTPKIGYINLF